MLFEAAGFAVRVLGTVDLMQLIRLASAVKFYQATCLLYILMKIFDAEDLLTLRNIARHLFA